MYAENPGVNAAYRVSDLNSLMAITGPELFAIILRPRKET
jgi:hypothetical protein